MRNIMFILLTLSVSLATEASLPKTIAEELTDDYQPAEQGCWMIETLVDNIPGETVYTEAWFGDVQHFMRVLREATVLGGHFFRYRITRIDPSQNNIRCTNFYKDPNSQISAKDEADIHRLYQQYIREYGDPDQKLRDDETLDNYYLNGGSFF